MRRNNIYKSAIIGLLEELIAIISGFILPRMILTYFGSDYNGIIASVTQFIGCIALLKSGIGMATKAALYDPLYNKEKDTISGIMAATMKFLRRVSYIFVVGIIVFACIYPLCIKEDFSWEFTAAPVTNIVLLFSSMVVMFFSFFVPLYYILSSIEFTKILLSSIIQHSLFILWYCSFSSTSCTLS
jgi:hypothetical protein